MWGDSAAGRPDDDIWFGFGGQAVAFNPANNSLFVTSQHGAVAEVSIPAPVIAPGSRGHELAKDTAAVH